MTHKQKRQRLQQRLAEAIDLDEEGALTLHDEKRLHPVRVFDRALTVVGCIAAMLVVGAYLLI
jgi:hypothetical protein